MSLGFGSEIWITFGYHREDVRQVDWNQPTSHVACRMKRGDGDGLAYRFDPDSITY